MNSPFDTEMKITLNIEETTIGNPRNNAKSKPVPLPPVAKKVIVLPTLGINRKLTPLSENMKRLLLNEKIPLDKPTTKPREANTAINNQAKKRLSKLALPPTRVTDMPINMPIPIIPKTQEIQDAITVRMPAEIGK